MFSSDAFILTFWSSVLLFCCYRLFILEITGDILRRALEKNAAYFKQVDPENLPRSPREIVTENIQDYNWVLIKELTILSILLNPLVSQ